MKQVEGTLTSTAACTMHAAEKRLTKDAVLTYIAELIDVMDSETYVREDTPSPDVETIVRPRDVILPRKRGPL